MYKSINQLTPETLANYFDHTLLLADAVVSEFVTLCEESKGYGFRMVAINSAPVSLCKTLLAGSDVHVGAAVGFPLGQSTARIKLLETKGAILDGCDEIDYVINIARLKEKDYTYIEKEMADIVECCREAGVISKVIFENCYLTDDEKREMCRIACNIKPDFIKTSTGFGTGGATIEDVKLMLAMVNGKIKVKAAGGIRNLATAVEMIDLGVQRIGSTAGVSIVEELKDRMNH